MTKCKISFSVAFIGFRESFSVPINPVLQADSHNLVPTMLISVHIPKTAGESFRKSLGDHFSENLIEIYHDRPLRHPPMRRNLGALASGIKNSTKKFAAEQCLHGHFLPLKYRWLMFEPNVQYVTWLRDPVERLASLYFFLKRVYHQLDAPSSWERSTIEEDWSLEQFCLCPALKNYYHQYLWGFPVERFDFIGLAEFYSEDFQYFTEKIIGKPLPIYYENVNEARQQKTYEIDAHVRSRIEAYHQRDVQLYQRVLNDRRRR